MARGFSIAPIQVVDEFGASRRRSSRRPQPQPYSSSSSSSSDEGYDPPPQMVVMQPQAMMSPWGQPIMPQQPAMVVQQPAMVAQPQAMMMRYAGEGGGRRRRFQAPPWLRSGKRRRQREDEGEEVTAYAADDGEESETPRPRRRRSARWPKGWFRHHRATRAGKNMAVVSRPNSGTRAVSMELADGLHLVGEVPEEWLDGEDGLGADDMGILPLLAPMMVRAAQKHLARNRVDVKEGEAGHPFRLTEFFPGPRDDFGGPSVLGDEARCYRRPRWFDRDEAQRWGFRRERE